MSVNLNRPITRHLIYPGMARSVPVTVIGPVVETGYTGFVWVKGDNAPDPVKVHTSRLNTAPVIYRSH
jgi:hypothetical protein